ncbi:unnamed protein product [Gordionus sp. m RMFG-2023]
MYCIEGIAAYKTRCKGNGARMIGYTSEKYKFIWQGSNDSKAGVGVSVAEKLVDKVVEVRRLDNQIMVIKMILVESYILSRHMFLGWKK